MGFWGFGVFGSGRQMAWGIAGLTKNRLLAGKQREGYK
jgi:hypothetical protein